MHMYMIMCACAAMYTYICVNACICDVYVYMSVYICECMYVCWYICVCMYMYMYLYMYVYVYICVHVCIDIYTHTKFFVRFAVQYLLTFHSSLPYYNWICWCWTASRNVYFEVTQEDFLSFSQNTFVYLYMTLKSVRSLKRNQLLVPKVTWGIWWILMWWACLKVCTLMSYFSQ